MISILLTRRFNIIKGRFYTTFGLLLLLPVFINVVVNLPFKRLVISPLWNIPHEQWIYPGLIIIVVVIMMMPSVYRDLFDLRIHGKLLPALVLTPVSKSLYLLSFLISIIIEAIVYTVVVMVVFSVLIAPAFRIMDYLIMFPFVVLFIAFIANILISLSLFINRTTLYNLVILAFFLFILFASGTIIEFEYFPEAIGTILRYSPTGQIMQSLRMAIFSGVVNWIIVLTALFSILVWVYFNTILFKRILAK